MSGTIIVPLDRSKRGEATLPLARSLAVRTCSRVLLTMVIPTPPEISVWFRTAAVAHEWVLRQEEAQRYLEEVATRFNEIEVDTVVRSGNPVVEILETARRAERPLLVLASHAYEGIKRMMIGSVTTQTVHSTPCPVVVIRAEEGAPPAPLSPLNHLLVALDGSSFAEQALDEACTLLGSSGLTLHLLRVVETAKWYTMGGYDSLDNASLDAYEALKSYWEWARDEATRYLEKIAEELAAEGNEVSWQVTQGEAAKQIVQVAEAHQVGLIVMATHGRAGLGRLLLGSVAEQVLHEARRPLMLVRPQEVSKS